MFMTVPLIAWLLHIAHAAAHAHVDIYVGLPL